MASSASADFDRAASAVSPGNRSNRVWENLKTAIAASSGFQRWKLEQQDCRSIDRQSLDTQVCDYLRETLETLAY
ncbi:MAG: hypothetical protein J7641_04740 [Cyanobacteria bacterium SID2]|nr:hypothetical protein [Cyanobacteria bacterium SID2]MBP0006120.1 hypothetical protein [Cyanobacteria bacterium SBC]